MIKSLYRKGSIYKINFPDNKCYIGKTLYDIKLRYAVHIKNSKSKKCKTSLCRGLRKYNTHITTVVNDVPEIFLNSFEKYWINHYNSFQNGFNMTEGGDGGQTYIWTNEQRKNSSNLRKGKPSGMKGKTAWNKGMSCPQYSGEGNSFYGHHHTDEQKKKWSILRKGRPGQSHIVSEETKKNMKKSWDERNDENIKCPYCDKISKNKISMEYWHFENCKMNPNYIEKKQLITCPHCGLTSYSLGNMNRWHFDNCKKAKICQ